MTTPISAAPGAWRAAEVAVDACDRCLALSELTAILQTVPVLRGTPEHDALVAAKESGELDADDDGRPPAVLPAPLVDDYARLAPTPGDLVRAAAGVGPERARDVARRMRDWSADAARRRLQELDLSAVCRCSTDYPESFRGLADPPAVLHVAGDAGLLDRCPSGAIGMVGTRHPTRVGREAARAIAMGIAQVGGLVVSGMAFGIDGASHDGALAAGAPTIAVLAGGADLPTPASHGALYDAIRATGAVVSELPPGTRPFRKAFPARNRIIAALSEAVIVVEAPKRSGALLTVDHAGDLGVDVFAVPGSLASPSCAGSNQLLCEGAGAVVDGVDFMALRAYTARGERPPSRDERPPEPPADADQRLLYDVLLGGPYSRQELARATAGQLEPEDLETVLTDLELSGWVARGIDGRYEVVPARRA